MTRRDAGELAQLMLTKARTDRETVERMLSDGGYAGEVVGFHAQQCCEKALKAVLIRHGVRHPFTHDLLVLIDLLAAHGIAGPSREVDDVAGPVVAASPRRGGWGGDGAAVRST